MIEERIDERVGQLLLWPLILLGIVSLLIWLRTDDLRLYAWVQFFPVRRAAADVLAAARRNTPARCTGSPRPGFYLLAKVLEYADAAIYSRDRHVDERPRAQARRRGRRLLRDLSGVHDAAADRLDCVAA